MQKKNSVLSSLSIPTPLIALTCFALTARLFAMALFPLTDKTEARYGEIARKMAETNDWITPQIDYGVPFWAKPPLSTWLSAISIDLFGVNEFAARLPSLLIAFILIPLMYVFSRDYLSQPLRNAAAVMLLTMGMFYAAIGTVMTDMTLVLACTLTIVSFWFALEKQSRNWGYVFFGAVGLALLAKGPAAVVMAGLPLFGWVCWTKGWKRMFSSLPLVLGPLWTLAIGVPWYIIAEAKTPGFLQYFIIGEHFDRFMVSGWKGDLYGRAHEQPLGMIWPFLLADGLPWSLILLGVFGWRAAKKKPVLSGPLDSQTKLLLCWLVLPTVFFTFAHNIIPTYPLVSLPALAVLAARELGPLLTRGNELRKWFYGAAGLLPVAVVAGLIALSVHPGIFTNTAYYASRAFHDADADADGTLVYVGDDVYSMDFYNQGRAKRFASVEEAVAAAKKLPEPFLALNDRQTLPPELAPQLKLVAREPRYALYEVETK